MDSDKAQALREVARKARDAHLQAQREYEEAAAIVFDTGWKNPDSGHGLYVAARRVAATAERYAKAMKEWADYIKKVPASRRQA